MARGRSTIGTNPLDAVVPQHKPQMIEVAAEPVTKKAITARIGSDLIERAQAAVYWSPGETITAILERALDAELSAMEKANGGPFKPPGGKIKTGRRAGT